MFEVRLSRQAQRYYERVDRPTASRLDKCFTALEQDPLSGPQIKPLKARGSMSFRYRVGSLRVLYDVSLTQRVVEVTAILPRGQVYREK